MKDTMEQMRNSEDNTAMFKALLNGIMDSRFIQQRDYLRHIEEQLDMYRLLQNFAGNIRQMAQEMEVPAFTRLATQYERRADKLFLSWNIPDAYLNSGDPDDLGELMENETYPAFDFGTEDDWESDDDDDDEEDANEDGKAEDKDEGDKTEDGETTAAFTSMSSVIEGVYMLLKIICAMDSPCPPDNR